MKIKCSSIAVLIGLIAGLPALTQGAGRVELVTTFDYPGDNVIFTIPRGINEAGDCVGNVTQSNLVSFGFLRQADGTFSSIQPTEAFNLTVATGINNNGVICGYFADAFGTRHGFLLTDGTFTQFDVPGATGTTLTGINDAGNLIGIYYSGPDTVPFLAIDGNVERIVIRDPHNSTYVFTGGINNADEFVGWYGAPNFLPEYGFFGKTAEKTKDQLLAPGALDTLLNGLNDNGTLVGLFDIEHNGHARALVLQRPHTFVHYFYERSVVTEFNGINNSGLICGDYKDNIPHIHGIIAQLTTGPTH